MLIQFKVKKSILTPGIPCVWFCVDPSDIEDLPPAVQEKLFDEVLDRDVQKGETVAKPWRARTNTRTIVGACVLATSQP